jgi:hypothetical protein
MGADRLIGRIQGCDSSRLVGCVSECRCSPLEGQVGTATRSIEFRTAHPLTCTASCWTSNSSEKDTKGGRKCRKRPSRPITNSAGVGLCRGCGSPSALQRAKSGAQSDPGGGTQGTLWLGLGRPPQRPPLCCRCHAGHAGRRFHVGDAALFPRRHVLKSSRHTTCRNRHGHILRLAHSSSVQDVDLRPVRTTHPP